MTIVTIEYKTFSEHSESVQEKIIEKNRYFNVEWDDWASFEIDYIIEKLQAIGFSNVKIYFSGFWSQGDGAQFIGDYSHDSDAIEKVKKDYSQDESLLELAEKLATVQELVIDKDEHFTFSISSSGHYSHELSTRFSIDLLPFTDWDDELEEYYLSEEQEELIEDTITESCREYMQDIYLQLRQEYDYLTSDESLEQYFLDNNYEFNDNGELL